MYRFAAYLLLGILTLSSCTGEYKIAGNSSVATLDGRTLYLKVPEGKKMNLIDSSKVIHGRFSFMGMVDSIMMAELCMDDESVMPLVLENANLKVKVDNIDQRVTGGPLNDKLYHFIVRKNQLDNQYMELSYEEMHMMMRGCSPKTIHESLGPKAEKLAQEIENTETSFIIQNYDNCLGPGVFMLICNQYSTPIMTEQIKYILKKAPKVFLEHPYVKSYVKMARENLVQTTLSDK